VRDIDKGSPRARKHTRARKSRRARATRSDSGEEFIANSTHCEWMRAERKQIDSICPARSGIRGKVMEFRPHRPRRDAKVYQGGRNLSLCEHQLSECFIVSEQSVTSSVRHDSPRYPI
jgi:hypothetical protein